MKVLTGIIILALSVIGITSCQKEIDWALNNRTQSDSTFLTKVITLDTTMPAGTDTVQKIFFTYDNARRLTGLYTYLVGSTDTSIYDFRYTGTDSIPYMTINKEIGYNGPGTYLIDSIFYYCTNTIVTKDSSIQWVYPGNIYDATFTRTFVTSLPLTKVYFREYTYVGSILTLTNYDSALYNVNYISGNLSSQTKIGGGAAFYNSVQASYDNKNNPLGKIVKFRYSCFENFNFNDWELQQNNPVQSQYQETSSFSGTDQYTYKYRVDGYPVSSTFFDSNGLSGYNKVLYFYISL